MTKSIMLVLMLLSLSMLLLAGCGTFTVTGDAVSPAEATATQLSRLPTQPASSTPEATATVAPTPEPTPVPTPEETASLPAPLYYINPADNQVWRVEQDGVTLTQISHEVERIEQYDVNPADGSVALVSDNSLIVTDALGGNRRVIASAPSQEEAGAHWYLFARISDPAWSADGQQLAYGLNGINFYDVATESSRLVLPNDEAPAEGEQVQRPINVYSPISFSPDNAFLLLRAGQYQTDGGGPAVLRLNTSAPPVPLQGDGIPCCTMRWSQDSTAIFSANDTFGMFEPGLWRSDAATGETEVVMSSETEGEDVRVFNWPQDLGNGEVAVFVGEGPRSIYERGDPAPMRVANVDVQAGTIIDHEEGDWLPGEAVWLDDGTGVALTDLSGQSGEGMIRPLPGTLYYLPLSGGRVVELPVEAHRIQWGAANG